VSAKDPVHLGDALGTERKNDQGGSADVSEAEYRYLAAIEVASTPSEPARTKDISNCLGVAPATVTGMLKRLSAKGLVSYRPYRGASLTPSGLELARLERSRVLVLERFFRMIGMSEEGARGQAREMGPAISDESYRRLVDLVIGNGSDIRMDQETDGKPRRVTQRLVTS
jgi:Mn-dependent DtxR family transcriptional regulator